MLVLSRKIGESLKIGDEIVVTVTRINGNRVTIGVVAPRSIKVRRGEISGQQKQELEDNGRDSNG